MTEHPLRFFSHSRVDADQTCERKRYLGSEWGETGLEAITGGWDANFGNILHGYLETLAKTGSMDALSARQDTLLSAREYKLHDPEQWAALAEGLLRGFVRSVWPRWMAEYEILETEKLRKWEVEPGYVFRFKQDLLLKNRFNGSITYVDYKSTSSDDPKWIASWAKHPQMHSSMYSLRQLDIPVEQCLVQGLFKGWKDKKTKDQTSIFTRGWVNREYAMTPQYSYTYQRSKGWEPFSTFDEFEDLSDWVANMPDDILVQQYPVTGPIFVRDDIAIKWFRQQMIREREVEHAINSLKSCDSEDSINQVLDTYFRQSFSKCQPAWGFECEFLNACWVPHVEQDPLGSGQFKRKSDEYLNE